MKILNLNPKGIKAGDCVVRAIAYATEQSWEDVYGDLYVIGAKLKRMMNEKQVYERYLEQLGWVKHKQPRNYDGTKFTIDSFNFLQIQDGKVIISVANHLTCIDHFELVDTWDCGRKCVNNYWTKDKE